MQPTFQLTDHNAAHVAQICRLAGGMPLGILLTAAWSHLLTPAEIGAEMQADIDFVAVDMPDLPARQRSMRAVFDHSWAQLSQAEQQMLAGLSVFRGGFTREAAQAVVGATLRHLLGLVNKSLLQRNVERGRFHMHELVRQLAEEKLQAADDEDAVRAAHGNYYLMLFDKHRSVIAGQRQSESLRILAADDQNIQAAWLWAAANNETTLLLTALEPFHFFFSHSGRDFEIKQLYREALLLLQGEDPNLEDLESESTLLRASILNRLQERGFALDDQGTAVDIDRLYAYSQARGAKREEAITCQHLGFRELERQNMPQAMVYFQRQISLLESIDSPFRLTHCLTNMSSMAFRAGKIEQGWLWAQRCLRMATESNDRINKPGALAILGAHTLGVKRDYTAADTLFAEVTVLGLELLADNLTATVASLGLAYQAYIALLQGDLKLAKQFSREQQEVVALRNNSRDKADAMFIHYLLDATVGTYRVIDPERLQLVSVGHRWFADFTARLNACGLGQTEAAVASLIQELSVPLTMIWPSLILANLPIAATIMLERGDQVRAVELLAMGRAHPACPIGWWEKMALVQTLDARLQAALSPAAYAAAQARGQKMDVQETAAALLDDLKAMV